MEEISRKLHKFVQRTFGKGLTIILDGGALWKPIESNVEPIFRSWCADALDTHALEEFITPHFKAYLQAEPNDRDWIFTGQLDELIQKTLIDQGLVPFLAKKLRTCRIDPNSIFFELHKLRLQAAKQPTSSFANEIFKEHPNISSKVPDLYNIFIKAFGFIRSADICNPKSHSHFSLRTIAGQGCINDCMFPINTPLTSTPINSLFIDITPLLATSVSPKLVIDSFLSSQARLQAFSDRNLALLTFDPSKPVDRLDFARNISFFTLGGRCYQQGWLERILKALLKECKVKQKSLGIVLARQLISRSMNHHQNEPQVLIVLAFNASALLYWLNHNYANEIQKLWRQILTEYDYLIGIRPHSFVNPIIKQIQELMNNPDPNFIDLYAVIQLSSAIDQHQIGMPQGNRIIPNFSINPRDIAYL